MTAAQANLLHFTYVTYYGLQMLYINAFHLTESTLQFLSRLVHPPVKKTSGHTIRNDSFHALQQTPLVQVFCRLALIFSRSTKQVLLPENANPQHSRSQHEVVCKATCSEAEDSSAAE